jgi:hypothetical protein
MVFTRLQYLHDQRPASEPGALEVAVGFGHEIPPGE